jgi:hypothetical protein
MYCADDHLRPYRLLILRLRHSRVTPCIVLTETRASGAWTAVWFIIHPLPLQSSRCPLWAQCALWFIPLFPAVACPSFCAPAKQLSPSANNSRLPPECQSNRCRFNDFRDATWPRITRLSAHLPHAFFSAQARQKSPARSPVSSRRELLSQNPRRCASITSRHWF